jgi:hypothetical protein
MRRRLVKNPVNATMDATVDVTVDVMVDAMRLPLPPSPKDVNIRTRAITT